MSSFPPPASHSGGPPPPADDAAELPADPTVHQSDDQPDDQPDDPRMGPFGLPFLPTSPPAGAPDEPPMGPFGLRFLPVGPPTPPSSPTLVEQPQWTSAPHVVDPTHASGAPPAPDAEVPWAPSPPGPRRIDDLPLWGRLAIVAAALALLGGAILLTGDNDEHAATTTTVSPEPPTVVTTPDGAPTLAAPGSTGPGNTGPGSSEPRVSIPDESDTTVTLPELGPDEIVSSPTGQPGPADAPVPAGAVADIGRGWRLQVLGVTRDATSAVMAAGATNAPPPAGSTFTLVSVAIGYFGLDDPKSSIEPAIAALGGAGVELPSGCGTIPDDLLTPRDFFSGGVLRGNLCFITTPEDVATMQLHATGDQTTNDPEVFLEVAQPASATPLAAMKGPQDGAAATPNRLGAIPLGTTGELGGGWAVTVTGAAHDITDAVIAQSPSNTPPPDGFRYLAVDVSYAFNGTGSDSAFTITTQAVADGNVSLAQECGVIPTPIDDFVEVAAGGSVAGSICFVVPADATGLVIYSTAGPDAQPVTFAAS